MPLKRSGSLSGDTFYAERNRKQVGELKTGEQDSGYLGVGGNGAVER